MSQQPINIADIRKDYMQHGLDEAMAGNDPAGLFHKWFAEAKAADITEVNAMTLATVDGQQRPHARIVLLKGLEDDSFIFFTNYDSHKGHQVADNPNVALVFFWKELERQVRVEGVIEKLPATDSDAYFNSRPAGSRLGAWASPQSEEISDRSLLDNNYSRYEREFADGNIPRPLHWGGYRVIPNCIEFWQGRPSRMHDRILFTKGAHGDWSKSRLAP